VAVAARREVVRQLQGLTSTEQALGRMS